MTTATRVPNEDTPPPSPPASAPAAPPRARPANTGSTVSTGTAVSRWSTRRQAVRKPSRARLMLSGATGSGKTWTALSIAARITAVSGGTIYVVDTEVSDPSQTAAELYADRFAFVTIPWSAPYDPRDLALTLRDAAAAGDLRPEDVLIVDSLTHFWRGEGGTLDIAGGRFAGWKVATPAQEDLVHAMIAAPSHVIACTRSKMDYLVEEGANGRQTVTRVGLAPVQRDDLEYEFQVVANLDIEHSIEISKTRCADLAGRKFAANHQGDFADVYASWLERGVPLATMNDLERVRHAVASITDPARRTALKREFKTRFGEPDYLSAEVMPAVDQWLTDHGLPEAPPTVEENLAGAHAELAAHAAAQAAQAAPPPPPHKLAAEDAEDAARARLAAARAARDEAAAVVEEVANEGAQAMTDEEGAYALGAQDGADAALEHAEREVAAAEAEVAAVTVETLKDRIAAIEGKATGHAPPVDEEASAVEAEAARWVAIWTECTNMRLTDLSAACAEAGLPAGGNKAALVERLAKHRYGA